MGFGRGYVRDIYATHDGSAAPVLAAAPAVARPITFLPKIGGVGNQGPTGACVGWAFTEAIALRAAALGLSLPRGSESGIYVMALQLQQAFQADTSPPLVDQGCQPALAVQAIRSFGFPLGTVRPWNPATLLDKLDFADLASADTTIPNVIGGFYGIVDSGDDRITQVRQALDGGIPVALSVYSSCSSFEDPSENADSVITAPTSWRMTDHMVSLVDYRPAVVLGGGYEFLILNHWGTSWGTGGLAWCDESFVQFSDSLSIIDLQVPA